jgi:hypothetical protein
VVGSRATGSASLVSAKREGESSFDEDRAILEVEKQLNESEPLDLVGIPRLEPSNALVFKPTAADRRRMDEIEAVVQQARAEGLWSESPYAGYRALYLENLVAQPAYAHPEFAPRLEALQRERVALNRRNMVPTTEGVSASATTSRGMRLPDGTKLEYYRRGDGSLIRLVTRPNGTRSKKVIGWTDLTPYYPYASVRDE